MSKKHPRLFNFILKVAIVVAIAFFAGGSLAVFWLSGQSLPDFNSFFDPNRKQQFMAESTKIYDRTGKVLLFDLSGEERRTIVPFEDISDYVKKATVAIEDSEFYTHNGIRPTSIVRAFLKNISGGGVRQGGSTITQQVIKNIILSPEKKITRKVKEMVLALQLEKSLDKDQILTLYLNEVPYGGNIYGVQEASQAFFGKDAKNLTLAESAYLAALPQAPTRYSPYGNHRDELEARKNLVLDRMAELKMISKNEATQAKKTSVIFAPPSYRGGIKAPHFVFFVRSYLEDKYGKEEVETKGLRVITTLDWELQKVAENVVSEYAETNAKSYNANNASMVAIDPKTGQILVMVGSRDYFNKDIDGNFNVALAHRQPGSSFKPFVYATAFNKGYTPETIVFDLQTQFSTNCSPAANDESGSCYRPVNYDGKYVGPITLRDALAQSKNIPAIKTLYLAGLQDSINTARRLGITGLENWQRYGLTLVLGGGEVTLLDMTSAYSVFANDGTRNPYAYILRVEDNQGHVLEEFEPKAEKVLSENTARLISDILSDNKARTPAFGATSPLYFPGRDVAAKTGTTNDYRDAWIIGYTPNLVVGTWAGNNDNSPMEKKVAGMIVAPMWNAFMSQAINLRPAEEFVAPDPTPANIKPMLRGLWYNEASSTVSNLTRRDYSNVHNILHWVVKNNPQGPYPSNPGTDSQYSLWEYPVQQWLQENNYTNVNQSERVYRRTRSTP